MLETLIHSIKHTYTYGVIYRHRDLVLCHEIRVFDPGPMRRGPRKRRLSFPKHEDEDAGYDRARRRQRNRADNRVMSVMGKRERK